MAGEASTELFITVAAYVANVGVPAILTGILAMVRWQHRQDLALKDLQLHIANESASKDDLKALEKAIRKVYNAVIRLEGQVPGRRRSDRHLDDDENDD